MMRDAIRVLVVCCAFAACGGNNSDDDETGATLRIDPPTAELLILNGVAATQDYTATLVFPDGHEKNVTSDTVFTVDAAYGTFSTSTVSIRTAGKTQVFGQRNDIVGSAQIIARLKSQRVDPGLPPNTPDLFGGTEDPTRAPTVVYPPADVVMPRNLGDFETHWIDPNGNDVFEVSLKTEFADVRVYVPGGNGNAAAGPMATFQAFLAAEWLAAVGFEPQIMYQVRGIQLANPGPVGTAPPRIVRLSNETMEGGLYYWAATSSVGGAYGIFRHDMAHPGAPAEEFMTTAQTEGRCVACHALSRDGRKMAITYDGGNGAATTIDVATSTRSPDIAPWNFATYNPDGSQLFTVSRGQITVRDGNTGAALVTMTSSSCVTHPDVSADGTRIVYIARPEVPDGNGECIIVPANPNTVPPTPAVYVADWTFTGGRVVTRTYDPVTHAFGAEQPLVTQGANNYYPSWSPDGQWILFNRTDGGDAYNNANANMFVIKADGAVGSEIALTTANQALALTNSWGRWAPFQQTVGASNDPIFWITVSSKRDFGVRLVGAQQPQIWMTPFFQADANAAADPSAAAFRLPFQNIQSNNHIAQWTERVITTQ